MPSVYLSVVCASSARREKMLLPCVQGCHYRAFVCIYLEEGGQRLRSLGRSEQGAEANIFLRTVRLLPAYLFCAAIPQAPYTRSPEDNGMHMYETSFQSHRSVHIFMHDCGSAMQPPRKEGSSSTTETAAIARSCSKSRLYVASTQLAFPPAKSHSNTYVRTYVHTHIGSTTS